jgi:hypothetical protein
VDDPSTTPRQISDIVGSAAAAAIGVAMRTGSNTVDRPVRLVESAAPARRLVLTGTRT